MFEMSSHRSSPWWLNFASYALSVIGAIQLALLLLINSFIRMSGASGTPGSSCGDLLLCWSIFLLVPGTACHVWVWQLEWVNHAYHFSRGSGRDLEAEHVSAIGLCFPTVPSSDLQNTDARLMPQRMWSIYMNPKKGGKYSRRWFIKLIPWQVISKFCESFFVFFDCQYESPWGVFANLRAVLLIRFVECLLVIVFAMCAISTFDLSDHLLWVACGLQLA